MYIFINNKNEYRRSFDKGNHSQSLLVDQKLKTQF